MKLNKYTNLRKLKPPSHNKHSYALFHLFVGICIKLMYKYFRHETISISQIKKKKKRESHHFLINSLYQSP